MKEIALKLTVDEANLILQALGNLPFAQVYGLIEKINQEASSQLDPSPNGSASAAGNGK
jgi:hypothetical protein